MTLGGFFSGSKGITWPDQPPKEIKGTITAVHPPEAVNDPKTGQPTDRMQVRIELATDERDPELQFDDGARTLYVKSFMRGAIGDALRRAGVKEPAIGGHLVVRFVRTEPADRPGLSPSKHFEAVYTPPTPSTAGHWGTEGAPASAPAPAPASAPVPQAAPPVAAPVKPPAISDAAWAAMDEATRRTVAATMPAAADAPPY